MLPPAKRAIDVRVAGDKQVTNGSAFEGKPLDLKL